MFLSFESPKQQKGEEIVPCDRVANGTGGGGEGFVVG